MKKRYVGTVEQAAIKVEARKQVGGGRALTGNPLRDFNEKLETLSSALEGLCRDFAQYVKASELAAETAALKQNTHKVILSGGQLQVHTAAGNVVAFPGDHVGLRRLLALVANPGIDVQPDDILEAGEKGPFEVTYCSSRDTKLSGQCHADSLHVANKDDMGLKPDVTARAQAKSRLVDVESEISKASANGESMKVASLTEERKSLKAYLYLNSVSASGSPLHRIEMSLHRVIARFINGDPALGIHLYNAVARKTKFSYSPASAHEWEIDLPGLHYSSACHLTPLSRVAPCFQTNAAGSCGKESGNE
jgi:hypothetical protein